MIGWILLCVFAALTFYTSGWWGIPLAIMVLWQASQWHRYKSRPWRRIHFPAMVLWSGAAGLEKGKSEKERRDYNPDIALQHFVKALNPGLNIDAVSAFAEKAFAQYKNPQFESTIRDKIVLKKSMLAQPDADKVIKIVVDKFKNPEPGLKAKLIIAEVIKANAGENEYFEYLRNVIADKAA